MSDTAKLSISTWMIAHSYATGHGDTVEDMLNELDWQARERGARSAWDMAIKFLNDSAGNSSISNNKTTLENAAFAMAMNKNDVIYKCAKSGTEPKEG